MVQIKGNVVDGSYFKERSTKILDYVANAISKTMGPYGHNVLIQSGDRMSSTKDGWNVMKAISFHDIFDNCVKSMIENAAQSVVLKVGDGTTTVTVAANEMNKKVCELVESNEYTIREIEDALCKAVDIVVDELRTSATAITEENMYDAIKKVAMVSTNWNEEISDMIATIYSETNNPIIKVTKSGTDKTSYKIINGYDLSASLMLGEYYKTDNIAGKCVVEKPWVFVTDTSIQMKHFPHFALIGDILAAQNKKLIIIAPSFDTAFLNKLRSVMEFRRANKHGDINFIPVKTNGTYKIDKECLGDFCSLVGARIMNMNDADTIEFFDDLFGAMTAPKDHELTLEEKMKRETIMTHAAEYLMEVCGTCDSVTIDDRSIIAEGLGDINDIVIDKRDALKGEIEMKTKECDALTMLTDDIRMKRVRFGKLNCKMGILSVGGFGDGNLKARQDAVDDATRACEAAYRNGYTIGSGLAIIRATDMVSSRMVQKCDPLLYEILCTIRASFVEVFRILMRNKHTKNEQCFPVTDQIILDKITGCVWKDADTIASVCTSMNKGYNLITDKVDTEDIIINPVDVDVEVLKGCMRLVIMMATSDQLVFPNIFASDVADDVYVVSEEFKEKPEFR